MHDPTWVQLRSAPAGLWKTGLSVRDGYLIKCYWHLNNINPSTQLVYKGIKARGTQTGQPEAPGEERLTGTLIWMEQARAECVLKNKWFSTFYFGRTAEPFYWGAKHFGATAHSGLWLWFKWVHLCQRCWVRFRLLAEDTRDRWGSRSWRLRGSKLNPAEGAWASR